MAILRTEGVTKRFGGLVAVDQVDFAVEEGELHALIGPNGAGKTTFFNLLSGAFPPTSGAIYFEEEEITGLGPNKIARRGIVRSFQISNLFTDRTVLENIRLGIQARSKRQFSLSFAFSKIDSHRELRDEAREIAAQVDLADDLDKEVSELAHGQKRKLEIGVTLGPDPRVVLLDEPAAGLTTEETADLMDTIQDVGEERTVLLIEHDMELVMGISERISVLHEGRLLAQGAPDAVRNDPEVIRTYIGEEEEPASAGAEG